MEITSQQEEDLLRDDDASEIALSMDTLQIKEPAATALYEEAAVVVAPVPECAAGPVQQSVKKSVSFFRKNYISVRRARSKYVKRRFAPSERVLRDPKQKKVKHVPLMSLSFPEFKAPLPKSNLFRIYDSSGQWTVVCFTCRMPGHYHYACPLRNKNDL